MIGEVSIVEVSKLDLVDHRRQLRCVGGNDSGSVPLFLGLGEGRTLFSYAISWRNLRVLRPNCIGAVGAVDGK